MAKMEWDHPKGPPDLVYRKIVRGVEGIGATTNAMAVTIGARAAAKLAPHNANSDKDRKPGESRSRVGVERGTAGVDAFVYLEDEDGGALAIEGTLNILRGSAYQ